MGANIKRQGGGARAYRRMLEGMIHEMTGATLEVLRLSEERRILSARIRDAVGYRDTLARRIEESGWRNGGAV